MDLILFELGDPSLTKAKGNDGAAGGSLIDGAAEGDWQAITANPGFQGNLNIKPEQCVELVSVNQGIQQQVTTDVSNSARTSGRPMISDFTCVKYVDVTSPKLYECCLRAKLLDLKGSPCRIHVLRNSGDRMNVIMQFELTDVIISEIQFQSHPNDMATEQFKLNFTEISWIHCLQGPAMENKGHVATGWSVVRNRPISPGSYTL
ncbi:Hcp family type VI secretion system effector [Oceanobacter mangrovi]|uniref:Hcp family type VI secretion system effector n=1 Tax=Oceanobacter mangrovi TaxID=2862510 RepID=UPI001C8D4029|nr:type VI secretion system tube protein Hcp [Oceanobacter mangrovi]